MDLTITTRQCGEVVVADLRGRLVLGEESTTLRQAIRDLLAQGQAHILLNLREVTRVDSSGIGTLVEGVIQAAQAGGRLKLLAIPRLLHNSLVIHRLLQAFEIFQTEEEALNSFTVHAGAHH